MSSSEVRPRRTFKQRLLRVLLVLCVMLGVVLALGLWYVQPYLTQARVWWTEAIELADVHARYQVAHPGWSFPARLRTMPTPLNLPFEKLLVEARARGYEEHCPAPGPGQFCPKLKQVVPRSGEELEPIELGWLIGPDAEMRIHLPLHEAPRLLIDAIMAAEDREFLKHNGVNLTAFARAAYSNAREQAVTQGASTLTMQLVRNLVQRKERTLERKVREAVMAVAVDQHLGKDQVLQMYLDAPYLGQKGGISICGFEAAARHYFGHGAADLTLPEAATLAAILPAPGRFAPDRFPELAKERRDRVLNAMREAFQYDVTAALQAPIRTVPPAEWVERYPSWISASRAWLEERLPPETLYGAGLEVTVGMDVFRQEVSDELFAKKVPYLENIVGRQAETPLQAAALLMDVDSGLIRVIYGGSDATSTGFNRTTQARRQAGSSYKPVVYALAFSQPLNEEGKPPFTAAHAVPNSPRTFKTAQGDWSPRNIAGEYTSTSALAQALAWSQNIATASLLDELGGPTPLIAFAKQVGFDTSKYPAEMGLALGQAEVTILEMTNWVATVAGGGKQLRGTPVLRATDPAGIERISPPQPGEQVLSPEAAMLTRELMRAVVDVGTGGKARGGAGEEGYSGPVMGKTGTTDKEKDLWFTGATPTLAAVLWLGYDIPTRIRASASDFASPLWGWWMRRITRYDGQPPTFPKEPKLIRRDICVVTGLNPNETCPRIGAPFLPGTAPRGTCVEEHPPPSPEPEESPSPGPLGEGVEGSEEAVPSSASPEKKKQKYESIWDRMSRQEQERKAKVEGEQGTPR